MTDSPVSYTLEGDVGIIDIDDGKANAIGWEVLDGLEVSLARAKSEAKALVVAGRPGRFSAGFDLGVVQGGGDVMGLMGRGGTVAFDLFELEIPVVLAVTGHAMAMGAVLLCCADYRVGAEGDFKIGLNEIRINLPVPPFAAEVARARLNPKFFTRATQLAEVFDPAGALEAGYLDELVPLDETRSRAVELATAWAVDLQPGAFRATRQIIRGQLAAELRQIA